MMIDKNIENLITLSDDEKQKLLRDFQGRTLVYDKNATFIDLFAAQAKKHANNIALVDEKSSLTYEETDRYTDCIAKELVRLGVIENSFVGIMLPRRKEFMVSVIGTMKAGGAYVPLDNEYPQERIQYMLADSEAKVLITEKRIYEEKGLHVENVIFIDEFDFTTNPNQEMQLTVPAIENLAYMIYTSGSTGKPKGVMIRHKSLAAFLAWRSSDYQITERDHLCCHSSFSFDASVYDLFVPLVVGGQLHIIGEEMRQDMYELNQYIQKQGITDGTFSTQLGMELLNQFHVPMKSITLGGEKLKAVKKNNVKIVNGYGPTEFTICSSYHVVNQEKETANIPIGKPVANSWAYVVDDKNNLMPIGVTGELCIAGTQIALGYWKRADLTKEKFIHNPFMTCEENAIMYRTGDLACWNEEGELEYVGRIDDQVKLRGFRIELGEIESAMEKFTGIIASVAEVKEIGKGQHLCGYFTANIEIDTRALKEHLQQSLTEYMVPTALIQLDKIPLTPNGKVDKKALPIPALERQELVAPQNERQQQLFNIVATSLGIEDFGITDDLFHLGMTSILAMKISMAIYNQFQLNIKTNDIIRNATIEKLENIIKHTTIEEIETVAQREFYPLLESQRGLYYEWEKDKEALQYNLPQLIKLSNKVDVNKLKVAILQVLEAHPYLKTCLGRYEGEVVQLRKDQDEIYIEVATINQGDIENITKAFVKPFDLFQGPLYRMAIYYTDKQLYLLMDIHHIIIDGSGFGVFINDVVKAYNGEEIAKENYTAFEYAVEQGQLVGTEKYLAAEKFFENKVTENMTELPKVVKGEVESQAKTITVNIQRGKIEKFCKDNGVTPNNLFMSALCTTLNRYTREEQIAIATISSGRNENKLQQIMGMFVKTLPIVIPISHSDKALDFIKMVQENMFETMENEIYPFTKIVEKHKIIPKITYVYQGGLFESLEIEGQSLEIEALPQNKIKFLLLISITPKNENYEILIEYDASLYTKKYIESLGSGMVECVKQITENPMVLCKEISIVSDEEIKILSSFNQTNKVNPDTCMSIIEMFKQQVKRVPKHIAVVYGEKQYTYQEIDEITDKLAKKLKTVGVGPEQVVGILIDRSEYMVIYPLAVLKAGGAYMPLDYSFPCDRLEFMIQDGGVQVILSEGNKVAEHIPSFAGKIIKVEELPEIEVDDSIILSMSAPHDMFVLLYTSGSTGMPKGCILENHNLVNYCNWHQTYYNVTEKDRAAAYANFAFDAHMLDIYPYITCGAATYIIPSAIRMDFIAINQYFEANQLSIAFMTTQLGRQFTSDFENQSLRVLIVGGEKLLPTKKPAYRFYNGYGPTECTIFATNYEIKNDYDSSIIGKPLDNYQLYVVDTQLQLLPVGVGGELCIGGDGVGRGYLNCPEITDEKFMIWNGKRIYRTGDLVRWTNEGEIEYLGRLDGQVKLRGLRIELGEIESQMLRYPGIASCAVAVKKIGDAEHLCAYYTAEIEIDVATLKAELATKLTAFMIPTAFMQLDQLLLTSNGKVNKKALPDPVVERQERVAPQTKVQQQLFDLVANMLRIEVFGITDDLFSMGMTSILAIKLSVGIYNQFNINIKTSEILKNKTVERLALVINNTAKAEAVEIFAERDYYPVTENQLGLYYEWEKDRVALQYNVPAVLKFSNKVDPNQLKDALMKVLAAHPYLNTCLGTMDGQIVQLRKDDKPVDIKIQKVSLEEIENIKKTFVQPFNLFAGPLYQMAIYCIEDSIYLFINIHHIIIDGSGLNVFLENLVKAYQGETLIPESYTAFEYAVEEEEGVGSEAYLVAEKFFNDKLEDSMTVLTAGGKGEGEGKSKIVINHVYNPKIETFCNENGVTPSNLFLSALCTVVHRYTREERIGITVVSSGRDQNKLHDIMGMFVKTLPMIVPIQPSSKIVDFVKTVQENMFETMEHEIYPFTKMAEKHKIVPQINYAYQGGMLEGIEVGGHLVELEGLALDKAKFPVSISVSPGNDNYEILIEYDDSLYTKEYIETVSSAIAQCAIYMVENPEESCKKIGIISKEEQEKVLKTFQGKELAYDQEATFIDLFQKQVGQNPEAAAIVDHKSSFTYKQAHAYSDCIAKELIRLGVKENNFVGVMLPRCKEFMVSVIGIMKAGGAYLPLDNEYPQERIAYMLEDSEARVLITQRDIYKAKGIQVEHVIFVDEFDFNVESNHGIQLQDPTIENVAYMIYTSGSTGKPKGVMIRHKSLVGFLAWRIRDYQLAADSRLSCHSSFSFDASIYDLFAPLVIGGQLHIISEKMRQDMQGLHEYIQEHHITDALFSTQFGMELINQFDMSLNSITLGGEKLKPVKKIDAMLVNAYGPTEFTIASSYHVVDQEAYCENIPIGKPVANSWSYIVDGNNNLMPIGVAGELCLAGVQIALGYWKREDLTKEKFVDNPFKTCAENAKMYRTGDLVAWNQAGELEYVGRIDNQIKLRGFRIELGEIESAMTKFPGITASVADIKEIGTTKHLCGYFTGTEEIDVIQLREQLSQSLTEYMVPTAFMQLDKIPLTPNGKVDKKALPALQIKSQNEYVPPTNELEEKLCTIFAETLHLEQVGIRDSFFELGGTSLLVMKVVVKAMAMDIGLTYANVFKYQKPQELAAFLTHMVEESVTNNDISEYDYKAIDQLLLKNTLGEISLTPIGDILLTGATGFLGVHVLKDFLEHYPGKVYCLMRSKDGKSADARLKVRLAYYFEKDYDELFGKRIFTIEGDMNQLVTSNVAVDTVINCAAIVKHFAAGDELEKVNVVGVQKLIDYCLAHNAMLIQVSTTSVSGTGDEAMKDFKITEAQLYLGQDLDNKYTHSKYVAERHILTAVADKGLKAKIMRVGNLMSRNTDGEFQINFQGNSFMSSLKAYKLLGKFPVTFMGGEAEFSPIDSTAKAILRLAQTNGEYTVFHPYNNHAIYLSDIIYVMKEYGFNIDIVSDGEFAECLREKMQDDKMISALTGILAYEANDTGKPIYALGRSNQFTTEVLYRLQFKWPMTSEVYIKKAIEALAGLGFFDE